MLLFCQSDLVSCKFETTKFSCNLGRTLCSETISVLLNYNPKSQTVSLPSFPTSTGGYYLTTLYASLYYISSFRPRIAARQLSVEAQHSLNQWHRRRTLHCNQSRRSKHRRTIRRQTFRERGPRSSDTDTVSKEESGEEKDSSHPDESQQQRDGSAGALQQLREETERERGHKDQSQTSCPGSDCQQEDGTGSKQEDRQSPCAAEEEKQAGL